MGKIRNSEGLWLDTSVFREAGNNFMKYGYYTAEPWGSPAWYEFWEEERRRILEGYRVDGVSITGEHYHYMNYCPIQKTERTDKKISTKVEGFPDFWDGDYDYFWAREIARNGVLFTNNGLSDEEKERIYNLDEEERDKKLLELLSSFRLKFKIVPFIEEKGIKINNLLGGKDLIVLKARRKGYSYKNASVPVLNYFHRPTTYSMLMAYDKKYLFPKGIFTMAKNYINFQNEFCAWRAPSDVVDRNDHIRNSYITYQDGVKIEKGYKSEIQAISFKDNPQAGVGKDCRDIIGEEVGVWGTPGGLKEAISSLEPSVTDGDIRIGMITLFGTANDIARGTVDFADMFTKPMSRSFLPFYDIWGDTEDRIEGFFFPTQMNLVGHYDSQGNSNFKSAIEYEINKRKALEIGGATSSQILQRMREFPLNSSEALTSISFNNFPVRELELQLNKVISMGWQQTKGTPVEFIRDEGEIKAYPILDNSVEPITSYRDLPINLRGCPVIYEYPIPDAPPGLYKIGYDPIDQERGTSLAAIVVYKGTHIGSYTREMIVAEYIGRYEDPDDIDRLAETFAEFYNTKIMHENMVTGVRNYFRRRKKLHLLAHQPDLVISKNIKKSSVSRVYGCHMDDKLKDAGERYVKVWLLSEIGVDDNGDIVRVLDRIYSIRLLEELISYNRKGNFDYLSALFMVMFMVEEEELGKEYGNESENKKVEELLNMMDKLYG